jgi:hypothetical protein
MRYKPVPAQRLRELEASLILSRLRVTPQSHASNLEEFEVLKTAPSKPFHWVDNGRFECETALRDVERFFVTPAEMAALDSEDDGEVGEITMPGASAMVSQHTMRRLGTKGGTRAVATNLKVGVFVVQFINYDGPEKQRKDFYIGKIVKIADEQSVRVRLVSHRFFARFRCDCSTRSHVLPA